LGKIYCFFDTVDSPVKTCAIVVAYQPDEEQLIRLLAAIADQVDKIFIVCNSAVDGSRRPMLGAKLEMIGNSTNIGLAAAQNVGLRRCKQRHADFVLFLDQDSLPPAGMVERLLVATRQLTNDGEKVAAVAPLLVDAATLAPWAFQSTRWFRTVQTTEPDARGVCPAEFLFSSGTLVSMDVVYRLGGFIEELFIDHVDLEWCMRASSRGYLCFGVPAIRMEHHMGSGHARLFGRLHPIHGAERDYYVFRNSIALMKLPHVPLRWKLNEALRLLPRALFYSALHSQSLRHLSACLRGMRDGIRMTHPGTGPSINDD
jgi:rhamnosyltransferase